MSLYGLFFYLLAIFTVVTTALAVTRRNPIHAVIFLIQSLLGIALLFYLLGAPVLAALEVIIYAGGIMVLFLFILVVVGAQAFPAGVSGGGWLLALVPAVLGLAAAVALILVQPGARGVLPAASAEPVEFGRFVFGRYWFGVEAASILLFAALVGAWYLGRGAMGHEEGKP